MSVTAVIDTAALDTLVDPVRPGRPGSPERTERPRIEPVPDAAPRPARPRVVFAFVAIAGLFVIVAIQLLVSVGLSQGAYQITELQTQQKNLTRANEEKQDAVDALSSPQNLAAAAQRQGMVANTSPVYLRLSDGAVLGDPAAAGATAASATSAAQNLVPNSLLAPAVPTADAQASATPSASTGAATSSVVPLQGELPAPVTH